ncbi:hypothetical protein CYMTET_12034 [Cymbomonas tetramitiformis]|uniref:EGF-like domain-containing protein n=1 Tax=Cymbomonas tetramitiformis TaxID=36881 RepID=A0AAE0LCJ6_9CHLO|nr:hypothetical protein CYMTET_12034 [Cymbomonas tetramitiformis]
MPPSSPPLPVLTAQFPSSIPEINVKDCPEGYTGNGAACVDIDGCTNSPCFPGVQCTDVAAPGLGYICNDCPEGYTGDGISCEIDECANNHGGCDPAVTCTNIPGSGVMCSSCPQGYSGDGTKCDDEDECAVNNGDCDYRTTCTNIAGSHACGECPAGYLGSGATGCILSTSCDVDNGGCHDTVTCSEGDDGEVVCGDCADGYAGTGATGCVDEDGCAAVQCYEGVHCEDARAPGTGAACGECPAGMIGDGVSCTANPCWSNNGGCDLQVSCTSDAGAPMGRVCGSCPAGHSDVYEDGTVCTESDGCSPNPCYPGVQCTDVLAPGDGAMCAECPAGFEGDGMTCVDVDECTASGSTALCDPLTSCVNVAGSFECTDCPEGYKGSGLAGCVPSTDCTDNNGGCDLLTTCTQDGGLTVCGACPEGHSGTGDTGCSDTDGCADGPCFQDEYGSAAQCSDVAAPGRGHTCGACPEGYFGDGTVCEACSMMVNIVDSSVVDGVVFSSQEVQIVGQVGKLQEGCTNTGGLAFEWVGSSSAGAVLELTAETNRAHTLTLRLPAGSLAARASYSVELVARMVDAPHIRDSCRLAMYVDEEPLQALVRGGGATIGEDNLLVLDGSVSHDPAGDPSPFSFDWQCTLDDGNRCRQRDNTLLPSSLTNATLEIHLQGSEAGRQHTFKLTVSKGARASAVYTTVTVSKGAPPVPVITPLSGKVNARQKLTLQSTMTSTGSVSTSPTTASSTSREPSMSDSAVAGDEVSMWWSVSPVADSGASAVDLDDVEEVLATSSRASRTLVLRPGALSEGGRYMFHLEAEQGGATGSTSLEVVVNSPPRHGRLEVTPAEGVALQSEFLLNTSGWEEEDLPLAASFSYRVIGGNASSARVSLSSVSPQLAVRMTLPEGGLEEFGFLVEVAVRVEDRFRGEAELVLRNVTVTAPSFESEEAKLDYVDTVMDDSEALLANGRAADAMNAVTGSSSLLTPESPETVDDDGNSDVQPSSRGAANKQKTADSRGEEAELQWNATMQRRRQREAMMAVVASAYEVLTPSVTVQSWVAGVALTLLDCPVEETSPEMRQQVLDIYSALVDTEMATGETSASMTGVADTLLLQLSAGEQPAEAASEQVQLRVQRDSLAEVGGTSERFLNTLIPTPGSAPTAVLLLPSTIHDALHEQAGEEVAMRLLVIRTDPHSNRTSDAASNSSWENINTACGNANATWQCHRVCSAVTSVSLLYANGTEMAIAGLSDPVELNLTAAMLPRNDEDASEDTKSKTEMSIDESGAPRHDNMPLQCAFWDAKQLQYSSRGCANLPNPAPRDAVLYWRESVVWEADTTGSAAYGVEDTILSGSQLLLRHWGMQHPWLLDGCTTGSNTSWQLSAGSPIAKEGDARPAEDHIGALAEVASEDKCAVLFRGNSAGCAWDQALQGFVGAGCEWSNVLQCKCSHLADFVVSMPSISDRDIDPTISTRVPPTSPPPPSLQPNPPVATAVSSPPIPPQPSSPLPRGPSTSLEESLLPPSSTQPLPPLPPPTLSPSSESATAGPTILNDGSGVNSEHHSNESTAGDGGQHDGTSEGVEVVPPNEEGAEEQAEEGKRSESGFSHVGGLLRKYALHVSIVSVLLVLLCTLLVFSRKLSRSSTEASNRASLNENTLQGTTFACPLYKGSQEASLVLPTPGARDDLTQRDGDQLASASADVWISPFKGQGGDVSGVCDHQHGFGPSKLQRLALYPAPEPSGLPWSHSEGVSTENSTTETNLTEAFKPHLQNLSSAAAAKRVDAVGIEVPAEACMGVGSDADIDSDDELPGAEFFAGHMFSRTSGVQNDDEVGITTPWGVRMMFLRLRNPG